MALTLSQAEFATAIRNAGSALGQPNACNKRLVQKWESGEHTSCRPNYRRALERVTRKPYTELGFPDAAHLVPRHVPTLDARRLVETTSTVAPRCGDDASEPLRHALNLPKLATDESVSITAERTAYLFALETHTPARVVMPMVERHIRETSALLSGTPHKPFRSRLTVAGGQSAALAGWLAFELGDVDGAQRYWDSAMACARQAADKPLLACVLMHLSYSAAERGDHNTAWQLAHTAISYADISARARAWASVRAAQEAAQLGNTSASLSALAIALDCARRLGSAAAEDDAEPWCRFVDRAYIYAIAANVYVRLGDADSAEAAAARALDTLSPSQAKTRALVLAEAARALTASGDTERATRCASEAAALAGTFECTRVARRPEVLKRAP